MHLKKKIFSIQLSVFFYKPCKLHILIKTTSFCPWITPMDCQWIKCPTVQNHAAVQQNKNVPEYCNLVIKISKTNPIFFSITSLIYKLLHYWPINTALRCWNMPDSLLLQFLG